MADQAKAAEELRIAEFHSLQAQINPHFLYNTMDMINWLAQQGRTDDVSTAVQSLSRFYKLTLQPLIENAVLHGILEKDDKTGTIVLTGWIEDTSIVLLISDDGVGIPSLRSFLLFSPETGTVLPAALTLLFITRIGDFRSSMVLIMG